MSLIKFSFNLQHMQRDNLPWTLEIDGKEHYCAEVIFKGMNGVTRWTQHSDNKKYGWVEIDGLVMWRDKVATIVTL